MRNERTNQIRDRVKDTVTMSEALDMLGLEPPNRAHKIRSLANPGERTPSLHVYEDHWYDFSTGEGGDVIKFVMTATGCTYHEALERLSGKRVDPMKVKRPRPQKRVLQNLNDCFTKEPEASPAGYRQAEGFVASKWPYLNLEDLMEYGVKITENEIWIPHLDSDGVIRGIKKRSTKTGAKISVTGSTFITGLYRVRHLTSTPVAILTEGESDLWCMETWLRRNGCSDQAFTYALPSGAATWRTEWVSTFAAHNHTLLCLDDDEAGRKATKRISPELGSVAVLTPPGGRVAEAIADAGEWLDPVLRMACKR